MFYYISQAVVVFVAHFLLIIMAVFVLVALFLLIIMAIESSSRYGKIIEIVIATAIVTALCVGGYTQYKCNTASVEKADNIEVVDKKVTIIGWKKTIVKYRGKKYNSLDDDLYKNVKIGEKVKGHVVKGTNELHDVDGYPVDNERETLDIKKSIS